jgi:hypothetical protein
MATFVLMLFLHGNPVTSIPGYGSEEACRTAGRAAVRDVGYGSTMEQPFVVAYTCLPGPARSWWCFAQPCDAAPSQALALWLT